MTKKFSATYLRNTLKTIAHLDVRKVEAQYEIANLLTAIRDHKLWQYDEHESFNHMVASELEFSPHMANKYCMFFSQVTKLGYKRDEVLSLMQKFGRTQFHEAISGSKKKMGSRAITNSIRERRKAREQQFHFEIDDTVAAMAIQQLSQFGATTSKSGRRSGMSEAFHKLLEDHKRLQNEVAKRGGTGGNARRTRRSA